jgi:hypothetical protein
MQPALDSTTLDRLISLGRERGHLTTEDLRASLPVERMSAEDIALVVIHLEETGVSVELEDSLLTPRSGPVVRHNAEIIPFPGPRAKQTPFKVKPLQAANPVPPEPSPVSAGNTPSAHWVVAAAGVLSLAVFLLIIFATAG